MQLLPVIRQVARLYLKSTGQHSLESSPLEVRRRSLCWALNALDGWPAQFLAACRTKRLRASTILKDFRNPPFWFENVIRTEILCGYRSSSLTCPPLLVQG